MAHHEEPMDVDCMDSDFDNKENTFHHSNVLPCTEKGYEELDVSELNMKLRYSITPAASPMSKSYSAYVDNRNLETDDSINCTNENANLTRSLNSTMTKNDSVIKSLKTLPLKTISTEQIIDNRGSVLRQLDSTTTGDSNVTVTISEANDINENLSLPSSSSSAMHTPEATSPTNITKNEEGSPIIRGLKSVFKMFRSSQSPIPPVENDNSVKQERYLDETYCEDPKPQTLASTPISAHRSRDGSLKRSSPLKDSIVFNDDMEKELQWKDDTILFNEEKIPVHKLFLPHNKPIPIASAPPQKDQNLAVNNLDSTVEFMDTYQNNSMRDNTLTHNNTNAVESDGEFVDCETTFTKNENKNIVRKEEIQKDPLLYDVAEEIETEVNKSIEKIENDIKNELNIPQTLDIMREIVVENVSKTKETEIIAVESKENKNILSSDPERLDVTRDIVENITIENENLSSNNEILKEPFDDLKTLDTITMETINKNLSDINENLGTDFEIQKKTSADNVQTFDATMKTNDEMLPHENICGPPESIIPAVETPSECVVSLPPKSIEISVAIPLVGVQQNVPHDKSLQEEKLMNESVVTEIQNVSNEMNQTEIIIEVDKAKPEGDIIITHIENEKIVGGEIRNVSVDPDFEKVTNIEFSEHDNKDIQVLQDKREDVYIKTAYIEHNLVAYPPENSDNIKINVSLSSGPENNIQTDEQAQSPNDRDVKPAETSEGVIHALCNLLAEEPANIPLPDNDDFDVDLEPNEDRLDITQTMQPDVLETVNAESKVDVTETLNKILDDTNIHDNVTGEGPPTSEIQDALDETNDIVNSLTEMIGESQNNTIIQPGNVFDLSQNDRMEGIEFTDEIQVLPDLVNQTIHNMSVDCEIAPEHIMVQSQSGPSTEMICLAEMHSLRNAPETISGITEQNKSISETFNTLMVKITTEQSNELVNENKEHTDIIVPIENIDVAPETNIEDTKNNEAENLLNEKKVLDVDVLPNAAVSQVVDEELVLSENNSPYVSVIAETEPKATEESFEKIDIPLNTSEAPSSPPIRSKGYNFNFDEMDDPFATKAKIRISSPATPSSKTIELDGEHKIQFASSNKVAPNRRRSQPHERKRPAFNKKKLNTTFDTGSISSPNNGANDQNSEGDSKNDSVYTAKNTTITMDNNNEVDKEVAMILASTQVLDNMVEDNINAPSENDISKVQLEEMVTPATDITVEISAENKSSIESMSTAISEVKTSSSEQSTYYSAAASSSDSSNMRNVFNLPEIDDKNFNPFATKSKMRQSPPIDLETENPFAIKSKIRSSPDSSMVVLPNIENTQLLAQNIVQKDAEDKIDTELMEKDSSYNVSNTTSSSKETDDKNTTAREVNTEDEDTEEGPFLEAEDAIDKLLGMDNDDMMQFNEIPVQATDENADGGELFIDAEAFEFLLNQNKSNVVADSGKESLFLKFDPLFAKRISSDGVLAALNKVHKRQSTPTKPTRPSLRNEASPIAGPSTANSTCDEEINVTEDSIDDLNITVAKPMMVVTPAVNPAVTPRNKTTTPPRPNRRSITFTSPAMAVIDRLLSLSGHNNSLFGQDTTITQTSREHIEADLALTQLRELLAEKEISVYQLRSESKELKERLSTMETQVKILEADGQERLNKINELNDRLAEKTKVNKSMAAVVEGCERTIASLIAETEQDKKRHAEERIRLINERDEQTAHLTSMEVSFSDLHSKYEKSKQVILSCKANEETCKKSIRDFEENLTKMQTNYELLKQHATSKLNHANQELQKMNKAHESEVLKLNAMIKRKEMHITSLEETLAQKTKANEELTAICDELINKVG